MMFEHYGGCHGRKASWLLSLGTYEEDKEIDRGRKSVRSEGEERGRVTREKIEGN